MRPSLKFPSIEIKISASDGQQIHEYMFPEKTLVRKLYCTQDMIRQGMEAHITSYPLKNKDDYDILISHMEEAYLDFQIEDFDHFDQVIIGNTGLPLLISGPCPFHFIMLEFAGYENFFYHLMDFPNEVKKLIETLERIYRRDLWPVLCKTKAQLISHGSHFSSQMTPPQIFEEYFLPYFKSFNNLMHEHKKKVLWHADAEMGALLETVIEAGFDGADCLLTAPSIKQTINDYFDVWKGKIICWGGLPSIIFNSSYPMCDYKKYVCDLIKTTKGRSDFIFGASDHVMPGAEWERLLFLARIT